MGVWIMGSIIGAASAVLFGGASPVSGLFGGLAAIGFGVIVRQLFVVASLARGGEGQ